MSNDLRGKILQLCGIVLLAYAFFMDTTVDTGHGEVVHNLGLLAKQSNTYLLGALALIAGIILGLNSKKEEELEQRRAADKALYIKSGEKFQLSNLDYCLCWILLILAAFQADQAWWRIVAFILLAGGYAGYKAHIFKKKIIAEMKAKSIEPIKRSDD